jgi:hypothetical protein
MELGQLILRGGFSEFMVPKWFSCAGVILCEKLDFGFRNFIKFPNGI